MRSIRGAALLLAAALVAGAGWAGAHQPTAPADPTSLAAGRPFTPHTTASFNRPVGTKDQQYALIDRIRRAISGVPRGGTIRIAAFTFSQDGVAQDLLAARRRGVHVQLIFDSHADYPAQDRLRRALGTNPRKKSYVVTCHGSCRADGGNMHHKLFLFSQVGRAHDVVMTGSVNVTRHNAQDQWADLYTVVGKHKLYLAFVRIFRQMRLDRDRGTTYVMDTVARHRVAFFPYRGVPRSEDPVFQALAPIKCPVVTPPPKNGQAAKPVPLTTVRISMFAWNGQRGRDLARRVVQLGSDGCRVLVILGEGVGTNVASILTESPDVHVTQATAENAHGRIFTHEKVFSVAGYYGSLDNATLVWTGSHNWSDGALRRDDLLLRIDDPTVFGRYRRNFDAIRALG